MSTGAGGGYLAKIANYRLGGEKARYDLDMGKL
jgi:hypothetical protein